MERKYTERELIEARRHAWADARYSLEPSRGYDACYGEAKRKFPFKTTKPRVVTDSRGIEWCFLTGADSALLMARPPRHASWINDNAPDYPVITLGLLREISSLVTNPVEEVLE